MYCKLINVFTRRKDTEMIQEQVENTTPLNILNGSTLSKGRIMSFLNFGRLNKIQPNQPGKFNHKSEHEIIQKSRKLSSIHHIPPEHSRLSSKLVDKIRGSINTTGNLHDIHKNPDTDSVDMVYDITTYIRCLFHDFRGPLNNIVMGMDVLSELITHNDTINAKDCGDTINNIQKTCDFMSTTLDGFLNISKITSIHDVNNFELSFNPFNIIGLLKKVQYLLMFNIIQKKITIVNKISNDVEVWVMGDLNHLQHVIYNITSNAIKFSKPHSKVTFELTSQKLKGNECQMLITVTDENEPIDKSVKEKMFSSYNTSNTNTGTGLGLYICKKIIDLHGGHISEYHW